MKTFLIVTFSVLGFFSFLLGTLVFLWFYQGGCCIKRMRNKINRKVFVKPVIRED